MRGYQHNLTATELQAFGTARLEGEAEWLRIQEDRIRNITNVMLPMFLHDSVQIEFKRMISAEPGKASTVAPIVKLVMPNAVPIQIGRDAWRLTDQGFALISWPGQFMYAVETGSGLLPLRDLAEAILASQRNYVPPAPPVALWRVKLSQLIASIARRILGTR